MKRTTLLTLLALIFLGTELSAQQKLTILHTNDLHASLLGNYNADKSAGTGSFARLATQIKKEKADADHAVLTLDAGDFLMGTLFQMLEMESGFELHLMQEMAYDAVCLGNHEFDFGVPTLSKYLRKAHAKGCPPIVLSNIAPANELAELYTDSIVKSWHVLEVDDLRIGLFGILGENAFEYSPKLKDYEFLDPVKTAEEIVQVLREEEKVDFVICLSHSGVFQDDKGRWENREDVKLAKKVAGIDAIISGHTHTKLIDPIEVNGVPIVQTLTAGMYLGKLTLTNGPTKTIDYTLIPINEQISPDPEIEALIASQFEKLKKHLYQVSGLEYDKVYCETNFTLSHHDDYPEKTSIGNFIADAMYYTVNMKDPKGTHIAMIAQGMIRSGLNPGSQSLPSIFKVASLGEGNDQMPGYPLSRLYFTGHELKVVLELLNLVSKNDPGYHCFAGGMQMDMEEKGGFMNKIAEIRVLEEDGSWQPLDCSRKNGRLIGITADSYMMEFLTVLKKKSFGLVNVKPKLSNGMEVTDFSETLIDADPENPGIQEVKVWGSMLEYAGSFEDTDGNGIPEVPEKYMVTE